MNQSLLRPQLQLLVALVVLSLSSCDAAEPSAVERGERLFSQAFPSTNGRSCATCHVPKDNFTLTPAHVAKLWESNSHDPLFRATDADDPQAKTLTFEHLKKGLVRVCLPLPDNVDVIDWFGNVTTPADRKIFVWRSVPSIADSALTAPYQLDGRAATLEDQAQSALTSHSAGGAMSPRDRKLIAEFVRSKFSSTRARRVAAELASGVKVDQVSDVEASMKLSPEERRGQEVYQTICAACHGGGNKATIVDRKIHDLAFPALKPDGTILYQVPATVPPTRVLASQPDNEFINVGSAMENFLAQIGVTEQAEHRILIRDLSFPRYRLRFYRDASRSDVVADLPPIVPPWNLFRGDRDGNPVEGPNFFPLQVFSTDPGRALITGSPYDFEAFDIPTLRGIGKTAPYFHNNLAETLEDAVELYSDHFLAKFPSLSLAGEKQPDPDGANSDAPDALTPAQKSDLVAFLKRL